MEKYSLPELPYAYNALEPFMSEEQLTLHHTKHHQAYVNALNATLEKLEQARKDNTDVDMKATLKHLAFNLNGHILHSLFWKNMAPKGKGGEPSADLKAAIERDFGSVDRLRKELSQAAGLVEGSGWATVVKDRQTGRLLVMQIEKHNVNLYAESDLLLVLDVWEHAYYIDYKNARPKFVEGFWDVINWEEVSKRA